MSKGLLSKLYVKQLAADNPPYQINETYQRFDQRNNLTVGRPSWDEEFTPLLRKSVEVKVKKISVEQTQLPVKGLQPVPGGRRECVPHGQFHQPLQPRRDVLVDAGEQGAARDR